MTGWGFWASNVIDDGTGLVAGMRFLPVASFHPNLFASLVVCATTEHLRAIVSYRAAHEVVAVENVTD